MLLSICIPTFNRLNCLNNCLNSILISSKNFNFNFEVCISDNFSEGDVESIINIYKDKLNINYSRNSKNLGHSKNFLKSVSMAKGDYVWTLGNDDLILPSTLEKLYEIIQKNKDIDFFFINSFNLESKVIFQFPQPFNTNNLPKKITRYSEKKLSGKLKFFDLINPKISFDFLMGMYLLVFRRKKWEENVNVIDEKLINDPRLFSTFENTCAHVKIISKAFSNSNAYFQAEPLSVNLKGEREWSDLYTFAETIRVPEILDVHKSNGLSKLKFFYYKNYALRNFIPSHCKMFLKRDVSGFQYINFNSHILKNLIYPNVYLSVIYFVFRKIKNFFS